MSGPHVRTQAGRRGQGLVEFALIVPAFLLAVFLIIDFGRLLYTYSAISSAAEEGSRILTLKANRTSDCYALRQMEIDGQAFPLVGDTSSVYNYSTGVPDSNPNSTTPETQYSPTTPGPGKGLIYIYPAVADSTKPIDPPSSGGGCDGNGQNRPSATCPFTTNSPSKTCVYVQIEYHFTPITPLVSLIAPDIIIRTVSVGEVEY